MIVIRPERPEDEEGLFRMYCQACGGLRKARRVDSLGENQGLLLSLVAASEGVVVGGAAFSLVSLLPLASAGRWAVLAPLAVLPTQQRQGIGSGLVQIGLQQCQEKQVEVVFALGPPEFFSRFGFIAADRGRLICPIPVPAGWWLVKELQEGVLAGLQGQVRFRPEFQASGLGAG